MATVAVGLLVSLVVSVAAWYYFDILHIFSFLPFVPILFRGRGRDDDGDAGRGDAGRGDARDRKPVKQCPRCGFQTRNPEFAHRLRDGARLEERWRDISKAQ
jgi:hypothetical protein